MIDREAKLRVLWVTATLGGGGAEMHLLRVLNALDRQEFEPALAVARAGGSYEPMLAADVPVFTLNEWASSSSGSVALSVPRLRAVVRRFRPAVLCSILDHVNVATLIATRGMRRPPPIMLCVQVSPTFAFSGRSPMSVLVRLCIRHLYHWSDCVVALSQGVRSELLTLDPRLQAITEVIPNAANDEAVVQNSRQPVPRNGVPPGERLVIACGRLAPQKGFHVLLDALAAVRRSLRAHLWILGEGPERARLADRASALGIADAVTFLGFQAQPSRYMAAADVFVLSSLFEGFANVVVEAMASGVPVVATDCPHGPGEIITDGADGLLVQAGSPDALAAGMLRVLTNPTLAAGLAIRGRARAADFHVSLITEKYANLMRGLARGRARSS